MASRLLVIDDSRFFLDLYQHIFASEGYEVHISSSGCQYVANIETLDPELIILDYHLDAEGSGELLLHQLKTSQATSSIPIILSTGDEGVLCEQEGFLKKHKVRVVLKPFLPDNLVQMVRQVLLERGKS